MNKPYRITWAYHNGTLNSRGQGYPIWLDTIDECKEKIGDIKEFIKDINHKFWFAQIRNSENEIIYQERGESYR